MVIEARFILSAKANAIQILTSQGCFHSECFTGVEHMSNVVANFVRKNLGF